MQFEREKDSEVRWEVKLGIKILILLKYKIINHNRSKSVMNHFLRDSTNIGDKNVINYIIVCYFMKLERQKCYYPDKEFTHVS